MSDENKIKYFILKTKQTVRTFLDGMIERKRGHIVGISSLAGKTTFPCAIAYAATKHGVRGFSELNNLLNFFTLSLISVFDSECTLR